VSAKGIDKDRNGSTDAAELRRLAEERLKAQASDRQPPLAEHETQRLIHELQVHQIELELQNAELRQARDEVENLLEQYTDLYDFAPVGYFTLDRSGIIRAANLSGARLLGVERARLLGRNFGLFVPMEARPQFRACQDRVFGGQGKVTCEVPLASGVAAARFLQLEAVAEVSGNACRVAVIDITERRLAEAALAQKRLELEELNRSLEERIAQAVDDLRQRDQMLIMQDRLVVMGEMINNIAHQWRQPLNILGLVIQQLPLFYEVGELSRELLNEKVGKGMELINHMSRTIDDFKNFFRSDKEKVAFSVSETITKTLNLVQSSFKEQEIEIAFHPESNPDIFGYPNEYGQVLLNILMNARDALLAQNVDAGLISIRATEEGGKSVVTITDNAGGIPGEIMERLFDPYFTTKGPEQGTGIGLYMSKVIIEKNMGGALTVRNVAGGAQFRVEV
jgi:PAS domain S-box-containing protein